ncbi:piggyBac transposable element-derived protein 3-like [Schistocerca serialis cubense]|uniref:piggyBac transposable element-derived protein 3-like n=1 Tax=Schistocerca serialis cubense TaxID=2023355 RepID=UPI00214F49BC|nr:piggyBac transposable element-derived protein 3-like [Schistocerca serialis cubense]
MVRYCGHHYLRQFIRRKPVRSGFKQWAVCRSQSGFCYHMSVYEGKSKTPEQHKIYFNNFFTSFRLMKGLSEMRVRATGNVHMNRMNNCQIESENSMKKKRRGGYDYRFDKNTEIMAVMWKDNNCVQLLSNHETVHPVNQVKRWSKAKNKEVRVSQPRMISECSNYMGGVDKLD